MYYIFVKSDRFVKFAYREKPECCQQRQEEQNQFQSFQ